MSDLTFELTEFFQLREMRLKAALFFTKMAFDSGTGFPDCMDVGVQRADELMVKLEETEE